MLREIFMDLLFNVLLRWARSLPGPYTITYRILPYSAQTLQPTFSKRTYDLSTPIFKYLMKQIQWT